MRHVLALIVSLTLALGGVIFAASPARAYTPDNEELTFLALINDYRAQNGLTSLSINQQLGEAAQARSRDMGSTGYFDHTAPDGTTFDQVIKRKGYSGFTVGENIAAGMETASEVMVAWQNSPEHNAGMLNPAFSEIGIGRVYVEGSEYGWYWTTDFGGGAPATGATQISNDGVQNQSNTTTTIDEPTSTITTGDGEAQVSPYEGENVIEAQQEVPGELSANGQNVSSNPGSGAVNGDGATTVFPDINTGGVSGDAVNYDQTVTPPTTSTTAPPPAAPVEQQAPVEQAPVGDQQQGTTTTTTDNNGTITNTYSENIQEGDGSSQALGNPANSGATTDSGTVSTNGGTTTEISEPVTVEGNVPVDGGTAAPADPAAAPAGDTSGGVDYSLGGTGCGDFTTWYDAQTAYENGGGLSADPNWVNLYDPNFDGVACEDLMEQYPEAA